MPLREKDLRNKQIQLVGLRHGGDQIDHSAGSLLTVECALRLPNHLNSGNVVISEIGEIERTAIDKTDRLAITGHSRCWEGDLFRWRGRSHSSFLRRSFSHRLPGPVRMRATSNKYPGLTPCFRLGLRLQRDWHPKTCIQIQQRQLSPVLTGFLIFDARFARVDWPPTSLAQRCRVLN